MNPTTRSPLALLCALTVLGGTAAAQDARLLAPLPPAAQLTLQSDMRDNLRALNEIVELLATNKVREAGVVAESQLGVSTQGRHRSLPFDARPGPHMPAAMHAMGLQGHQAATAFATIAATGDRDRALAALPAVTATCVACHYGYRIR
jgi:hypothetical protein